MDVRPAPPQGPPPPYAFVAKVYKKSLRNVVAVVAFAALLWTLFGAIGYFRNAALDNLGSVAKLRAVYIVMGALYMLVASIELLGLIAAGTQRLPLIRLYAYGSALVVLIIAGTGLLEIIVHFTAKDDIINVCTTQAANEGTVVYFGFWGPVVRNLDQEEANALCQHYWDRDSWQDIVAFLVTTFISACFASCAFGYLRQMLDPSSAANVSRPSIYDRNRDYPSHYNPAYQGAPIYGDNNDAFVPPPYEPKSGYTSPQGKTGYSGESKDPFADHASGSRV